METDNDPEPTRKDCEEKLKQLEEENKQLRDSSHAFGELARLNTALQQERRQPGNERRQRPRPSAGRRQ